ncbi:hypothetical protein KAR91_50705 [Candidatus Pacearchaeota archaeon]|nr:hypothetical protein [Candidatus Pacearchaeota archaeon]
MDRIVIEKVNNGFIVSPWHDDRSAPAAEAYFVFESTKALFCHIQKISNLKDADRAAK